MGRPSPVARVYRPSVGRGWRRGHYFFCCGSETCCRVGRGFEGRVLEMMDGERGEGFVWEFNWMGPEWPESQERRKGRISQTEKHASVDLESRVYYARSTQHNPASHGIPSY